MRILTVTEFLSLINETLKALSEAEVFAVKGEVSGYRVSQGQWASFDLKDGASVVNVFLPVWKLTVPVEDGMSVRVFGVGRVYPKYGKFSLSAERIECVGEGALRKALAQLRARLEKEGLFDVSRKRALPRFPSRIALIASRESAAYGDFVRVVGERWGGLAIDVYHVQVQGERAVDDMVRAIAQAQDGEYDALVLTRGGGSFEELMPFNDERLVRAIHGLRIPTLVAIGHERDVSLAEEAADVRGSTPTDCARRLVPDRRDVAYELATVTSGIESALRQRLETHKTVIERALHAPGMWISKRTFDLDRASSTVASGMQQWLCALEDRLRNNARLLSSMDPKRVLSRGYALVRDAQGRTLTTAAQLRASAEASVMMKDGEVGVTVSSRVPARATQPTML